MIIGGITYYHIEGVESFSSQKKRVFIQSREYNLMYLIDFSIPYKTDDGYLKGYRLDEDGVVSNDLEIIRFQKNGLWIVH